jgi:hypothetical protein
MIVEGRTELKGIRSVGKAKANVGVATGGVDDGQHVVPPGVKDRLTPKPVGGNERTCKFNTIITDENNSSSLRRSFSLPFARAATSRFAAAHLTLATPDGFIS